MTHEFGPPTHQKYGDIKMHTGNFVARFETPSGPVAAAVDLSRDHTDRIARRHS
jgi:hypothetical protein